MSTTARLGLRVVLISLMALACGGPRRALAADPPASAQAVPQATPDQIDPGETEPGEDLEQVVRRHIQEGDDLVRQGRYGDAVTPYQAAYELDAQPALLYKMAECQRRVGRTKEAVRNYDRFVHEDPKAPQRAEAERQMKDLYRRLRDQEEAERESKKPVWKKPWFWGVIGGSVAVVGIAVGVGLAVGLRSENTIN